MVDGWKQRLEPASYRGVPFLVEGHEAESGRRSTVHEFPQRDQPMIEDIGRAARRYRVSAIILGPDYDETRDRLIRVCETRGSGWPYRPGGLLVHPYLGRLHVHCQSIRVRESTREGRMCRVEMEFVESPGPVTAAPASGAAPAQVATAGEAVRAANEAHGAATTATKGPQSIRDATAAALRKVGRRLASLDVFSGPAQDVRAMAYEVNRLKNDALLLATAPADAFAVIRRALKLVLSAPAAIDSALFAYEALFNLQPDTDAGSGSVATTANLNRRAVIGSVREMALAGIGEAGAAKPWRFREEAAELRAEIVAKADSVADFGDDTVQTAREDLVAAASRAIPPAGEDLPTLATITTTRSLPALVLGYRLYDDADRALEIEDRTGTRYPGFMPALEPIEVLSR